MKYVSYLVLAIVVCCCLLFMSMDGKKLKLKGTKWVWVEKIFVADAGTMTVNHTLDFTTKNDVIVGFNSYMPPHPAMYMNPDGEVPTMPGWSNSDTKKGTYKVKGNTLTITFEDGSEEIFDYRDGNLVSWKRSLEGKEKVYVPCTEFKSPENS